MLTTLAKVTAELIASNATTGQTSQLLGYIADVTRRIKRMSFNFEPRYGTEYITAMQTDVNSSIGLLSLKNIYGQQVYLLASSTDVPSFTVTGTALTFGTSILAEPQGYTPIRQVRLSDANNTLYNQSWYPFTGSTGQFLDTIVVTGWWGFRTNYGTEGFLDSGDTVLGGGINASVTTITVADVDGVDYYFQTPRFSPGNLIRIENELCQVWATDIALNTLTVRRGQNGTTAAAHAQGTAISVWFPEDDIVRAATRWACLLYARRGTFEKMTVTGVGVVSYPDDCPGEVFATLQGFNNL